MSGTSAECTQRTGRSSPDSPATSRGAPIRTGSSAITSRTVGNTAVTAVPPRRHARHVCNSWPFPDLDSPMVRSA
ncbi:hypothetical protein GCM10009662_75690 [Catellatospora coxensis]